MRRVTILTNTQSTYVTTWEHTYIKYTKHKYKTKITTWVRKIYTNISIYKIYKHEYINMRIMYVLKKHLKNYLRKLFSKTEKCRIHMYLTVWLKTISTQSVSIDKYTECWDEINMNVSYIAQIIEDGIIECY